MSQIGSECFSVEGVPNSDKFMLITRGYYQPWELKHSSPGLLSLETLSLNLYRGSFGNLGLATCGGTPKFNVSSQLMKRVASPSEAPKHSNSRTSAGHGQLCRQLKSHSPAPCLHGGWSPLAWKKKHHITATTNLRSNEQVWEVDLQQDKTLHADRLLQRSCNSFYSSTVMVELIYLNDPQSLCVLTYGFWVTDTHGWCLASQSGRTSSAGACNRVFSSLPLLISSKENAGFKRDYVSTTQFLQMTGTYLDCNL